MQTEADKLFQLGEEHLEHVRRGVEKETGGEGHHDLCHSAREAIRKFLESFLAIRNARPEAPVSLEALYELCCRMDERFHEIEFNAVNCRFSGHDQVNCSDLSQISTCGDVAEQFRTLALD